MTLKKPKTREDLIPPVQVIGEPAWEEKLRSWLNDFDFDFGEPCPQTKLALAESRLGIDLPTAWRTFLLAFGALDFGPVKLSSPEKIIYLDNK